MKWIYPVITCLLLSCGTENKKFDKNRWNDQVDGFYVNRENMIEDLISNRLRKGMSYSEVVDLLGKPDNYSDTKSNAIAYEVMVDYKWDIDPVESKILYIELSVDSTVTGWRVVDHQVQ